MKDYTELPSDHYSNLNAVHRPFFRKLRVFANDPSLANSLETASINEVTLKVIWEVDRLSGKSILQPGPIGEYLEVIDYDPASRAFYAPVDLNNPYLLAQDGLQPSEENPQFHQQMVYAVAMTTIDFFEQALGRVILWSPRVVKDENGRFLREDYVQRLRIYPHALREANAYYSINKKAILFGYFKSATQLAAGASNFVFTCLSQDIIVHELTHALLDGIHPRYRETTNPDVHAFHEAFADIIALFQHFSNAAVLEDTIRKTRGNLSSQNLLGKLAQEFGEAIGHRGALRDAIGYTDAEGQWHESQPDPTKLAGTIQPHARGSILVAAVFRSFLLIYRSRIQDLLRIASQGSGKLAPGELHPDLVKRLSAEAAKVARHILIACIRALDYCPPVDISFGDYLRAIITGDIDMEKEDRYHYRIAFVQSFKSWGIQPGGIRNFSVESLSHRNHLEDNIEVDDYILDNNWNLYADRREAYKCISKNGANLHKWLTKGRGQAFLKVFGLTMEASAAPTVRRKGKYPSIEVHSVRPALRRGPRNNLVTDIVAEITQARKGFFDPLEQRRIDAGSIADAQAAKADFIFRRGCTLIIDMITQKIRYVIKTEGDVNDDHALDKVRRYLLGDAVKGANAFHATNPFEESHDEYFARIHRH
ncbi:MAG: hypothetical protein AAGG75_02065 [Bacteroidota bacterium]